MTTKETGITAIDTASKTKADTTSPIVEKAQSAADKLYASVAKFSTDMAATGVNNQAAVLNPELAAGITNKAVTNTVSTVTGGAGTIGASGNVTLNNGSTGRANSATNPLYAGLLGLFKTYNIEGIASTLDNIISDFPTASGDQILNMLRYDPKYNAGYLQRFSGNALRAKNGLPMLDEGSYLTQEQGYAKAFKAYNQTALANTSEYANLIANDVSVTEATSRISLAYDRVLNADPATLEAFKKFYPTLTQSDLVAAMLSPAEQLPALERKVQSAEIGGAALRQGLQAELTAKQATSAAYSNVQSGTVGSDTLQAAGVQAGGAGGATAGYQAIAQELPTMEKLSSLYANTNSQYGQKEAEQNQLLGLASAQRKKQDLINRENAQFSGQTGQLQSAYGINRTAFGTSAQGSI